MLEFSYFSIFVCSLNLVRQGQQNIEVKRDRNIVLATAFLTIMFHVIISVNNNNIFQNLFIISFPEVTMSNKFYVYAFIFTTTCNWCNLEGFFTILLDVYQHNIETLFIFINRSVKLSKCIDLW